MDPVIKGLLIFGAVIGYLCGIALPPIVHINREITLSPADFGLQSFFPLMAGLLLVFGCLTPVFMDIRDDTVIWPLLTGGIAILAISTACMVGLFATDRVKRMAN
jgi:hypothetical protein